MHTFRFIGLVAAIALAASGCGAPDTPNQDTPPPTSASDISSGPPATTSSASAGPTSSASTAPTVSPSTSPTAPPSSTETPGQTTTNQLGQPAATRTSSKDGKKLELNLYPLVRDGAVSHLNLTLSSPVEKTDRVQVGNVLSDGNYQVNDTSSEAADGLQLLDGKHSKLYLVASDGKGHCVCSNNLFSVTLQDNVPVVLSATFAAPPADVTTVDVRVPNFGTVKSVPVQ